MCDRYNIKKKEHTVRLEDCGCRRNKKSEVGETRSFGALECFLF